MTPTPATKQDLARVEGNVSDLRLEVTGLSEKVESLSQSVVGLQQTVAGLDRKVTSLDQKFDLTRDTLVEAMRQIETNLLTEFHRYAKGQTARTHSLEVSDADLKLRMAVLEDRVLELESRIRK